MEDGGLLEDKLQALIFTESRKAMVGGSIGTKLQAAAYDILPSFGGRYRKAMVGV